MKAIRLWLALRLLRGTGCIACDLVAFNAMLAAYTREHLRRLDLSDQLPEWLDEVLAERPSKGERLH